MVRNVPDHADLVQRLNPFRRQIALLAPVPAEHTQPRDPRAEVQSGLRFIFCEHVQIAEGLVICLRGHIIPLPREVAVAAPDHADLIQLCNAFCGKNTGRIARADALLCENPVPEGIAVRRFV